MTMLELMKLANEGYSDGICDLMGYINKSTGEPLSRPPSGDTLALFVVRELAETFDPDASDDAQMEEAMRVIESASSQLDSTLAAINKRYLGV